LPVVPAIEHDEEPAGLDAAQGLRPVAGLLGEAQPQHVHRRAEVHDLKSGKLAQLRVPPIGADHQIGAHLERAVRELRFQPHHAVAVPDEIVHLGQHPELEGRIQLALVGEEIEEVPLREEGDEAAARGKMGEVGEDDHLVADDAADLAHLLVRQLEKRVEESELVHHFERGGMDGVAAEVAQEIGVLLQHQDVDAGAGEQEAEHHAGRAAPGDGAGRRDFLRHPDLTRHARPCAGHPIGLPGESEQNHRPPFGWPG
jgi:hypothetical protein